MMYDEEAKPTPTQPILTEQVDFWMKLANSQRAEIVRLAKEKDPQYRRSYAVPGRCVNIRDDDDRDDCYRFAVNIVNTIKAAEGHATR